MPEGAFLLELGLIILALSLLARMAGRLGLSAVPLYLLAGLAFGRGGIAPLVTAEGFIRVGAEVGVILLLLMLGLEYSAQELTTALRRSAPAGVLDIVLNFTPGLVAAFAMGWTPMEAVFLGGVTYISSSGIVAKLLGDLNWLTNRETPAVLSILVFEDLVMVFYLPLVAGLIVGDGPMGTAASVGVAVAVMVVTLIAALRFGPLFSRLVFTRSDEVLLLSIIGFTLVVAGFAEQIHAPAAVAAFLVGVSLSGPAAQAARSLLKPVRDLFAVVFFFLFGLETDPGILLPVLPVATALAVATGLTKWVTGRFGAARAGVGPRARRRAGVALIARGEFSVVIAGLATAAGLRSELGSLTAAYVLIMAVAGPVAAKVTDYRIDAERARDRERAMARRRAAGGPYGV